MEENYKTKAVLKGMMSANRDVARALALPKKQQEVLDILVKHNVTTDLSKLPEYKRKPILDAIKNKTGMGYETRKAFHEAYGAKKPEPAKPKTSIYDEIRNRGKNNVETRIAQKSSAQGGSGIFGGMFRTSKDNMHKVEGAGLIVRAENKNENDDSEIRGMLNDIQNK